MVDPLRVDGVDISHHQAGPLDMPAARQAGVRFIYHKATEGATFKDARYPERRIEAAAAGLLFGAYHFASPDGGDALAEAQAFLAYATPKPGNLLPVLDLEANPGGLTRAELTAWVGTFVAEVKRVICVKPVIYTPFDLDDTHGCLLWVARYHNGNAEPNIPAPWTRYDLRQFSNGVYGVPNSVPGFGNVDLNTLPSHTRLRDLVIPDESVPRLRIGHGNGRNEQSLVQYVRDAQCTSFSAQEAQQLLPDLRDVPGYRVTVAGDDWTEDRNRAKSTSVLTLSKHPNIGELTRKVSERIESSLRVAPDRVLVASFYEHPVAKAVGAEGIAHFSLHPDAGPVQLNGDNPDAPIVREYREALDSTRRHMETARKDGLVVILTGDLQVGARHNKPWGPRPQIARPLDLAVRVVRIDWVLVDKRLKFTGPLRTRELFDHTGFVAILEPANG